MNGGDTNHLEGAKYPLDTVQPLIRWCKWSYNASLARVIAEFDCSDVEAGDIIRKGMRRLTAVMFKKRKQYADGTIDDEYRLPMDGYEKPWFVKFHVDERGLYVSSFHPQDLRDYP